jgi:WD40 repeat protein
VRRERGPRRDPNSPPPRPQSHSMRNLSPTRPDDSSASVYSARSRRERLDSNRLPAGTDDDVLSAFSRARRERHSKDDDEKSSYSRTRHDRIRNATANTSTSNNDEDDSVSRQSRSRKERIASDEDSSNYSRPRGERSREASDDDAMSAYSRTSDRSNNSRLTASRLHSKPDDSLTKDRISGLTRPAERRRIPPARAKSADHDLLTMGLNRRTDDERDVQNGVGGGDLTSRSVAAARVQIGDRLRTPPARAKSADNDLLTMDLKRNQGEIKAQRIGGTRQLDKDAQPDRSRPTDLTTLLRERREARAAEREVKGGAKAGLPSSTHFGSDVDRNIVPRRSGGDELEAMATTEDAISYGKKEGQGTRNMAALDDLEPSKLEGYNQESDSNFSINVRVVSAIDLPQNVIPNMPLCPVMKIGYVRIPQDETSAGELVVSTLGDKGVESIRSARVRSTTSKIMSKRDNGTVDFHQELRWDRLVKPEQLAIFVELSARAVRTPTNYEESPPSPHAQTALFLGPISSKPTKRISTMAAAAGSKQSITPSRSGVEPTRILQRNVSGSDDDLGGGLRALWRKATNRKAAELEAAEAAAAVARMLVEEGKRVGNNTSEETLENTTQEATSPRPNISFVPRTDCEVALRKTGTSSRATALTKDVRLGTLVIPLSRLHLEKTKEGFGNTTVEKWFQLEGVQGGDFSLSQRKQPSVRLRINVSGSGIMNEGEEKLELQQRVEDPRSKLLPANEARDQIKEEPATDKSIALNPALKPGVVDFIAVVGCRDIGNQKDDHGNKGWVESSPECALLEQFPPDNEFHLKAGRKSLLPEMVQWFCFPEGARLWRGSGPPSHADLNLKRFSASSPPNVAASIAAFDACLNCTTSFSWFVIASNSDEYGSKLAKTYGAVIRFYAPAPPGVDPKQEDYAQTVLDNGSSSGSRGTTKRLWVPLGICLTSSLPIVGVLEAMLLRLCEDLVSKNGPGPVDLRNLDEIHEALAKVIVKYQKPIPGAVNCSFPFLTGDRFLLSLPSYDGLPPLPHGKSIVAACRLLGTEGLNFLLAAVLTECKILIHSQDIADIAMVAEVVTTLIYPFSWSLPYIPILPVMMLEFVDMPLSFILGVPSQSLKLMDSRALEDVVVIDLDSGFSSSNYFSSKRMSKVGASKNPPPLPSQASANISKALYKLLRAEEEADEEFGVSNMGDHTLPRLETETLAEREFRVSVAIEICGLLRGYQECTGPVFNRDKFLKIAPALFEERRDRKSRSGHGKMISPRSKRFVSLLVNTQNFHQFIESLENEDVFFFHEVMDTFEESEKITTRASDMASTRLEKSLAHLVKTLQKIEDKVPTYRVDTGTEADNIFDDDDDFFFNDNGYGLMGEDSPEGMTITFTNGLLLPIAYKHNELNAATEPQGKSSDYLAELEKTPWRYRKLFDVSVERSEALLQEMGPVKLKEAIGDRRYRTWRMTQDQKEETDFCVPFAQHSLRASNQGSALDLTTLISSASKGDNADALLGPPNVAISRTTAPNPEQQRVVDAKDRDIIRRCLDRAQQGRDTDNPFLENGRDLLAESEKALRNPSAQRFLLYILAQRSNENQRGRANRRQSAVQQSVSRLDAVAFECIVRLSCAILDSCMEYKEYETAYHLLTLTAGFITLGEATSNDKSKENDLSEHQLTTMTSRIGTHPVFANLTVWETVMSLHIAARRMEKKSGSRSSDIDSSDEEIEEDEDEIQYEASVATIYEMMGYSQDSMDLSRFAMRVSEQHGWFSDDRGRQLLLLARRITVRRDQTDGTPVSGDSGIELIAIGQGGNCSPTSGRDPNHIENIRGEATWIDIAWCHPAAPSSMSISDTRGNISVNDYMKRCPITASASFGRSVVVTGGLDGGVFLAYSIGEGQDDGVRGVHLDWGSASRAGVGSSSDGEYGVGAVSCLAATVGGGQHALASVCDDSPDEMTKHMDGSRIVAGTTAGDLRVWSLKDVYSSLLALKEGNDADGDTKVTAGTNNAQTRLKFSLRGRALSGHRGGVTCLDVPSQVYRPDSLVTGGADGLIKLWSLRSPASGRRQSSAPQDAESNSQQRARGGDALSVLTGHNGRIACVKTAWHGDRLVSGGADRKLRVWDLASGGKCLNILSGHSGWVTHIQHWGANTIVSGSTDRTLALWDVRVSQIPIFTLRYHNAPITDVLVGTRTDPLLISAAADGTIATWDFRALSQSPGETTSSHQSQTSKIVRQPRATMNHNRDGAPAGQVLLCRGILNPTSSVLSVGPDAIVREWDTGTGKLIDDFPTGHCDIISNFQPCRHASGIPNEADFRSDTMITSSLDGTIRTRRLQKAPLGWAAD